MHLSKVGKIFNICRFLSNKTSQSFSDISSIFCFSRREKMAAVSYIPVSSQLNDQYSIHQAISSPLCSNSASTAVSAAECTVHCQVTHAFQQVKNPWLAQGIISSTVHLEGLRGCLIIYYQLIYKRLSIFSI